MNNKIYTGVVIVIALIFGIPTTFGQDECPQGAEFIISFNGVLSADVLQDLPDPNLTFFRNVLKFTEQEIQTATQSAIEHFNTTFGLDFSQSEPNQQGVRIFQNSSFSARQAPFIATAKANRWLAAGNTKSKCFDVRLGWFGVSFLGQQVLHGTYGGTEGRAADGRRSDAIAWLYLWIDTCPQSPVVLQLQPTAPVGTAPNGFSVEPYVASHRTLGNGICLITSRIQLLPPDRSLVRYLFYHSIIFPGGEIA